ncbi:MAG: response regulator transcription factor [Chloroflexi bacterium]|nr:response regulator transcription factor [Chloroflexota bacterium]
MSDAISVIVADDHPLFLEGVVHSLRTADDIAVVGQAADAAGALRLAREHLADVVLLDIAMPGSGLQAARDIATACPATKIVMLTVSEDEDDLLSALKAGASGYVLKGVSARDLASVVRAVHRGEVYVAPALAGHILREMTKPRSLGPLSELTAREREVLELVAAGLSNHEIGGRLSLAEKTVKHYMTNILAKLQVRSRVEAALLAFKAGLGPEGGPGR